MLKVITGFLLALGFIATAWSQELDLNKASEMELDGLNGVGPAMTRQVMNERLKSPFKDWADVTARIKGIGPQKANSLSAQGVRVQGLAFEAKASASKK